MSNDTKTLAELRLSPSSARFIETNVATATGGGVRGLLWLTLAIVTAVVLGLWVAAGDAVFGWLAGDPGEALRAAFLFVVSVPLAMGAAVGVAFLVGIRR